MSRSNKVHLLILFVFIGLTILVTWPLIIKLTQLTVAGREEFFLSYILNWNIHALTHYPLQIFQTPFFHPLTNTLAFSDPLFTSAIITLPFVKIFNQPFLAYSINLLIAFALNGFFTYLVVFKLTKKTLPALISGILMAFSIGRIDTLEHLQVFTFYWIPLGLYFFLKFIDSKKNHFAALISLCFLFQIFNTIFLGFIYALTITIFSLIYYLKKEFKKPQLLALIKYFSLALIIVFIMFLPYLKVSKTYQYTRSIKDTWGGSAYFLEYFYPTQTSKFEPLAQKLIPKRPWPAYLGAAVSLLGFISLFKLSLNSATISLFILSLSGFILSLGPYLQLTKHSQSTIPLPYLLAYYLIPGFKSMRAPQRWSHLLLFGFSILSGLLLSRLFKHFKPISQKLITIFIITVVILEIKLPLFSQPVSTSNQIPAVYHWLNQQPPSIVLEIPAQSWVMKLSNIEITRLHYHSFILGAEHKFVNGFSGFTPPVWMDNMTVLRKFPQQKALTAINNLQVDTIIFHHQDIAELKKLDPFTLSLDKSLTILNQQPNFDLAYQDDKTTVYTISPLSKPQALQ